MAVDYERPSTDTTTIVSIYSMYGDSTSQVAPSNSKHDSFYTVSEEPSELAYDGCYEEPEVISGRNGALLNGNGATTNGRPISTATSFKTALEYIDDRRNDPLPPVPNGESSTSPVAARARPPRSRPPTNYETIAEGEPLSPNPNPPPMPRVQRSSLSRPPSSQLLQVPSASTNTSESSTAEHEQSPDRSEEADAFYVRSVYAELENKGVKGDGYVEGVERTRARTGGTPSRSSTMRHNAALADEYEKTRDLTPIELATLSSLDRYGFFTVPSHDRLVLLPRIPMQKHLSTSAVPAGPPTAPPSVPPLPTLPPAPPPRHESTRIGKWSRMLLNNRNGVWTINPKKEHKLRERAYKGIPDRWRSAAWEVLVGRGAGPLHRRDEKIEREYNDALDVPSPFDVQIDLDVPRTISGHIMFRTRYGIGQRALFHVLHAFSLRCSDCGYVQGMGPIAATFLCYTTPPRAYALLAALHDSPFYRIHTLFQPGFPGLLEALYVQERATQISMPVVFAAFKKHGVSSTAYATKWYITLFANSVPFQTQLRLWDAFLYEGRDVFIAVSLAVVWAFRDQITSAQANFETILSLLSSSFVPEDEDVFMLWIGRALADEKLRTSMTRWRGDWKRIVERGEQGTALL